VDPERAVDRATPSWYLLDTSALRALSSDTLRRLHPPASISPFAFYELASHLEDESFARQRGHVLKCRQTEILDDPGAELLGSFGTDPRLAHERVSAGSLICSVLDALDRCTTLTAFYACEVRDEKGNVRLVRDLARRAADILEREETAYAAFVGEVIDAMRRGLVETSSGSACNDAIMALVQGRAIRLKGDGVECPDTRQVDDRCYLFCGYVFERARCYCARGGGVKANDFEDASIVMHMRLAERSVLVSGDRALRRALRAVLGRLAALGFGAPYEVGQDRILSIASFEERASRTGAPERGLGPAG